MKSFKSCFIILLIVFPFISHAQWSGDSLLNTVVSDVAGFEDVVPLQQTTSDGKTFISWFQSSSAGYIMKMQLLDKNGNKKFGNSGLVVSSNPQNSAIYRYDLKVDINDNAVVAFQDERTGNLRIYAYKIDTTGTELWGANGIELHSDSATTELAPAIGILSNNDVVIAWNAGGSGSNKWVPYQKISAAGSLVWPTPLVIPGAPKFSRPSITACSAQQFIIVFIQETGIGLGISTIKAQKYDASGIAIWPSITTVSTYTTGFAAFPKVVPDDNDGCYIGFDTGTPGNPSQNDVFVQHISSSGNTAWTVNGIEASSLPTNNKSISALTFRNADHHIYVLLKITDGAQGQSGMYAQSLDTSGTKIYIANAIELLPVSGTDYIEPGDWSDAGTGFIAIYNSGLFGNQKMRALKMNYSGQIMWTQKSVSADASNKSEVTVGSFKNNQVVCVWEDDKIDEGIYAQNIDSSGNISITTSLNPYSKSLACNVYISGKTSLRLRMLKVNNYSLKFIRPKESLLKLFQFLITLKLSMKISFQPELIFIKLQVRKDQNQVSLL